MENSSQKCEICAEASPNQTKLPRHYIRMKFKAETHFVLSDEDMCAKCLFEIERDMFMYLTFPIRPMFVYLQLFVYFWLLYYRTFIYSCRLAFIPFVVYIVSTLFPTISLSFTAFRLSLNYQLCTTTADFSISLVYL